MGNHNPIKQKRSPCSPFKQGVKKCPSSTTVTRTQLKGKLTCTGRGGVSLRQSSSSKWGGGQHPTSKKNAKELGARGSAHSGAAGLAIFHAIQGHLTNNAIMMKCFPPGAVAPQPVASFVGAPLSMLVCLELPLSVPLCLKLHIHQHQWPRHLVRRRHTTFMLCT